MRGRGGTVRFDTTAYLAQSRAETEGMLARGETLLGSTHPEHYVRFYAEWLFSESDLYASLTGLGSGSRSIADVDETMARLIGIDRLETPVSTPPITAADLRREVIREFDRGATFSDAAIGAAEALHRRGGTAIDAAVASAGGAARRLVVSALRALDEVPAPTAAASGRDELDPLEDDRDELERQFAELERREREG